MRSILTALLLLCATPLFAQFSVGDQVQVVLDTDCLNVRSMPVVANNVLKCEIAGTKGVINGGPIVSSPYTFWQITYSDGITGWSAGQYLTKIGGPVPPPITADTSQILIQLSGFKIVEVRGDSVIIVREK